MSAIDIPLGSLQFHQLCDAGRVRASRPGFVAPESPGWNGVVPPQERLALGLCPRWCSTIAFSVGTSRGRDKVVERGGAWRSVAPAVFLSGCQQRRA